MMVTNHDASLLPGLRLPDTGGSKKWKALLFDRILADVPCSGDGTLRKNLGIWREWNVGNGMGLHPYVLVPSIWVLAGANFPLNMQSTTQDSTERNRFAKTWRSLGVLHMFDEPNGERSRCLCSS